MDVSNIDIEIIDEFDTFYMLICGVLNADKDNPSPKMQKKIRKKLYNDFLRNGNYPKRVSKFFSNDVSDSDFIDFFKSCSEYISTYGNAQMQRFDKAASSLAEDVKDALWSFMSLSSPIAHDKSANTVTAVLENSNAFCRTLTLHGATCPDILYDFISFDGGSLVFCDGVYKLAGMATNYDGETEIPFIISFTHASVSTQIFDATKTSFANDPWTHLEIIATSIVDKQAFPGEHFNEKEKKILPLLFDLCRLTFWSPVHEEYKHKDFDALSELFTRHGGDRLIPLLGELSANYTDPKTRTRIQSRLNSQLNKKKYEPLWREIYDIIRDSQSSYPASAEFFCSNERKELSKKIERLLTERGYTGEYPDFYKKGAIKGIRLANSYNETFLITGEKNVEFYIHCDEDSYENTLSVQFLCGTALLRKNEETEDIYSCTFNAKGKRIFNTVTYTQNFDSTHALEADYTVETATEIAAKKAELKKLSKKEKRSQFHDPSALIAEFFSILIFMGGLFAIGMTLAMALISVIVTALVGLPGEIPNMLLSMPWWLILVLSWVGFGGSMAIITLFSKTK